ncbi:MAG: dihydrodipicolinate synthase family protein [Alphaproteobacteria bacterium]|nr:dihydrodipicolinate synthase family protein [Alphaproteobacteria bacterium]
MSDPLSGVWSAAVTPMNDDLSVNLDKMVAHHKWLLANGCDGIAVLGTTGEANSFSLRERLDVIAASAGSGIAAEKLMIGTGCCALPDTIELTRAALEAGFDQILMLPPFYYKGVGDDGLFACYDQVIQKLGDDRMRIVVYDFPAMTGLEIGTDLLVRLNKAYPETVVGVKDSSGNWDDMQAVARAIPGFRTFAGTELYLLAALKEGGAGCITATGNATSHLCQLVNAAHLAGDAAGAEAAQETASAARKMLQAFGMVPGMKELMAQNTGDGAWRNMRPPILPLSADAVQSLNQACRDIGFTLAEAA